MKNKNQKQKVYAWDRSAIKEQNKLEEEQETVGHLIYMFQNWEYLWNDKRINFGEFEKYANYLLKKYNVVLEN